LIEENEAIRALGCSLLRCGMAEERRGMAETNFNAADDVEMG
jgi:hypothetical protein